MTSVPSRLHRRLTLRDLTVYGLLFIGPLAPVGVFGVLDAQSDGAVGLVYAVATAAMAFTAWSYAEMSRVVPHAGSVFAYATAGLGPMAGFFAGWLAMLDYLLIPSVAYLFSGIALHALVPAVPAWGFTVVAFLATTALNLRGVGAAARVGFVVLLVELAALAVFLVAAAVVLASDGPARPWLSPFAGFTAVDRSMVGAAVSIAVLSFLGFDAIASFAEENAGDTRQVGRAIGVCLAVAGAAFVAQTALASLVSPISPDTLVATPARQGTAFYDIVRAAIGGWLAATLAITKAVGPAFAAMTAQAAAARLLFGMARDGRLPRALGRVEPTRGVPATALATTGALTLAVAVWAARRPDGLPLLVSIVDVGALSAFTMLHASVVGYFVVGRHPERRLWHVLLPMGGAVVTLWILAEASRAAQIIGAAWAVVGVAAYLSSGRSRLTPGVAMPAASTSAMPPRGDGRRPSPGR